MKNKMLIIGLIYITIGLFLSIFSFVSVIDEWWQSFGIALSVVGMVDIIRFRKYRSNSDYREKVDLSQMDERNKFLAMKAWSWAGYLFVIISGLGVIGFQIAGLEMWSLACSGCVCLVLLLYWGSYMVLRRKY